MYHTFVIICAIFAVIMAVNFVIKAADIRKTIEEAESSLRNLNHLANQLHSDNNFNIAKVLASTEGVRVAVEEVKKSADGVKESVDNLERSSSENVNRYIDFIRSITPADEQPAADPTLPEAGQETLLVENDGQPGLKEGEALAEIFNEPQNPAAE